MQVYICYDMLLHDLHIEQRHTHTHTRKLYVELRWNWWRKISMHTVVYVELREYVCVCRKCAIDAKILFILKAMETVFSTFRRSRHGCSRLEPLSIRVKKPFAFPAGRRIIISCNTYSLLFKTVATIVNYSSILSK